MTCVRTLIFAVFFKFVWWFPNIAPGIRGVFCIFLLISIAVVFRTFCLHLSACLHLMLFPQVSEYEAVHSVRHWKDLKHRVGPYRRVFVFTHRSLPREPIVILHSALTQAPSSNVQVRPGTRGLTCLVAMTDWAFEHDPSDRWIVYTGVIAEVMWCDTFQWIV